MNNSVLEAALTRAAEGLPIFPCNGTDKSPLTPRGHLDATTDPERIRAWWKQHPDALVAYPTGPRSGRDALDLDPRHGSAVWFQASGHRLPPTRVVATRSGGQHWLFRHREGMRNSQNNPAPGVDIRGEGGYVIDWSCHGGDLWIDEPLAEWPDWLLAQITTRRAVAPRDYAEIRPPSTGAVCALLNQMPNPATVDRETWVAIGLAASGCAHALGDDQDDTDAIGDAWVAWSQRWPGAAAEESDRSRWETDLATKSAPKAGWPDLLRHAKRLGVDVSAQRLADAQEQFEADEPEPASEPEQPNHGWKNMLCVNEKGHPRAGLDNATLAFRHAPEWRGVLGYDQFADDPRLIARPPWEPSGEPFAPREFKDTDFTHAAVWLAGQGIRVTSRAAAEAMAAVADSPGRRFNPAREYFDALRWDGTPRLDAVLIDYLGAEDTRLNRAFGSKTLIAAVRRSLRSGLHRENRPDPRRAAGHRQIEVLSRTAAPRAEWFSDTPPDIGSKDSFQNMRGILIMEHAELATLSRADAARAKAFISSPSDRYRPSSGRVSRTFPRQGIFIGTVNPGAAGYLKDETGGSRFWPVKCAEDWPIHREVDAAALQTARDQLWAEAVHRCQANEPHWLTGREDRAAQQDAADDRYDDDAWADAVLPYLRSHPGGVTTLDVLAEALHVLNKDAGRREQMRVGAILRREGWERRRIRDDGGAREYRFMPPSGYPAEMEQPGASNVVEFIRA